MTKIFIDYNNGILSNYITLWPLTLWSTYGIIVVFNIKHTLYADVFLQYKLGYKLGRFLDNYMNYHVATNSQKLKCH